MLSKIKVNKAFIEAVMKNKGIPEQTKAAIKQLKGSEYQYVEYFILDVIKQEKKLNPNENIDVNVTLRAFQKNAPEVIHYKKLVSIYRKSMGMKMNFSTPFSSSGVMVRDEKLFNLHKVIKSKLDISITSLQDIIREQRISQEFKYEKLGIGKATEQFRKRPQDLTMGQLAPLIQNDVQYARFPRGKYESNCNKTAASLYQLAKNREIATKEMEQRKQQDTFKQGEIIVPRADYQKVKTPTIFSIGSGDKERMALWQGVKA
ncbi:hypothetical protein [uncultured Shewanella sp.]|uniref:hypothetical protein n=1 Tax=uncultured Shewanella sp. TaxID=173975 RepID=UPI002625961B|nr:hypothetical protein [uncultured Shewanella sp.]